MVCQPFFHDHTGPGIQIVGLVAVGVPAVDLLSLIIHIIGVAHQTVLGQLSVSVEKIFLTVYGLPARQGCDGLGTEIVIVYAGVNPAGWSSHPSSDHM